LQLDTILVISSKLTHSISAKNYLSCSVFFEDEDVEAEDTPEIPCSETAQHADNHLDAVWAILLNPLAPPKVTRGQLPIAARDKSTME